MSDVLIDLRPNRDGSGRWTDHALITTTGKTLNDAADEIVRLRAAVAALAKVSP